MGVVAGTSTSSSGSTSASPAKSGRSGGKGKGRGRERAGGRDGVASPSTTGTATANPGDGDAAMDGDYDEENVTPHERGSDIDTSTTHPNNAHDQSSDPIDSSIEQDVHNATDNNDQDDIDVQDTSASSINAPNTSASSTSPAKNSTLNSSGGGSPTVFAVCLHEIIPFYSPLTNLLVPSSRPSIPTSPSTNSWLEESE